MLPPAWHDRSYLAYPELFSFDFVDPWYWYRTYRDDRKHYLFQHQVYERVGRECDGVTFFGNDTFGELVRTSPLGATRDAVWRGLSSAPASAS